MMKYFQTIRLRDVGAQGMNEWGGYRHRESVFPSVG